jgi:YHS domain-containing protein
MRVRLFLSLLVLLVCSNTALADKAEIFSSFLGGAIRGYDPVAYFTQGRPVKGSGDFILEYKGATWKFSSAENRQAFVEMPEKYAPQYGGYCAYAVSQGYTASIDPQAWTIVDERLYLNYSKDVRAEWSRDIPGNIKKANANWPGVLSAG